LTEAKMQEHKIKERTRLLDEKKRALNEIDTELKVRSTEVDKKRQDLADKVRAITAVTQSDQNFPDVEEKANRDLADLQKKTTLYDVISDVYLKFLDTARDTHACPLCSRGFEEADSLEAFLNSVSFLKPSAKTSGVLTLFSVIKLMETLEKIPETQRGFVADRDKQEILVNKIKTLRSDWDAVTVLRTVEIPTLETAVMRLQERKVPASNAVAELTVELDALKKGEQELRVLQRISERVSTLVKDSARLGKEIADLEQQLAFQSEGQSLEEVRADHDAAQVRSASLYTEVNELRTKYNGDQDRLREVERRQSDLGFQHSLLQQKLQRKSELLQKLGELESQNQKLARQCDELTAKLQPIPSQILEKQEEKARAMQSTAGEERKLETEKSDLRMEAHKLKLATRAIDEYERGDNEGRMARVVREIEENEAKKKSCLLQFANLDKDLQVIQGKVGKIEDLEKQVKQNLRLRELKAELANLDAEIAEIYREAGRLPGKEDLQGEVSALQARLDDAKAKKHWKEGGSQELHLLVRKYQAELKTDLYHKVEERYRDELIKLKTTELSVSDLEKYMKAIDMAIMKYHSLKMEEINKIVKELWVKTYRGQDIDAIEIRSEDDKDTARSYNYRVVMIKGNAALDMRGRCSAGQKVLASIIIRLALAETFGLQCGILALDEPTTNLDRENIESLAQSLAE